MSESDLTDLEGDLDKVGFFQNLFFKSLCFYFNPLTVPVLGL